MVGNRQSIHRMPGIPGQQLSVAAEDGANALTGRCDHAQENGVRGQGWMHATTSLWQQGDGHAGQNQSAGLKVFGVDPGSQPEPLGERSNGCRQTLNHERRQLGTEHRQGQKQCRVADSESDQAADDEPGQGDPAESGTPSVGVDSENRCGQENPNQTGRRRPQMMDRTPRRDRRQREEEGGECGGNHAERRPTGSVAGRWRARLRRGRRRPGLPGSAFFGRPPPDCGDGTGMCPPRRCRPQPAPIRPPCRA